ncbi:protein Hook homolog 3-like [Rhodnius prolixus]
MDKAQLCDILFKWLQTFEVERKYKTINDLTDGVAMAQVLCQVAPEWFTVSWLSKIKTDTGGNWRLKVSNLKKVLEKILDYYQECFSQTLSESVKPDVVKIGDRGDASELGRLLQLILGCAVNCNNKQEYIKRIMDMEESEQRVMMECIQELDSGGALSFSASLSLDPHVEQLVSQLNAANLAKEQAQQKCHELDLQVTMLQEEKAALIEEKKKLFEEVQCRLEASAATAGGGPLRRQVEMLKDEMFKLETSRDDYRLKLEHQEREMLDLQTKLEDLQRAALDARQLKDELDVLRETADKVVKYEATLQSYKKKLEEAGDVKRELKLLETKNLAYIQQNMELEEELKKCNTLKQQVDVYKKQTAELHDQLTEETKRADRLQYELKTSQDKLSAALREKKRLLIERDSLKEANEEMKCAQLQAKEAEGGMDLSSVSEGLISNSELRQKVARLEHENNMLRLAQKEKEEDSLSVVQNLLDDATAQVDKMCKENREANKRIIQLEGELREFTEKGEDGASVARTKIIELQQQAARERQKHSAELEEKESALSECKQIINLMTEKLSQKELELQESEEKVKKYLEKARIVAKAIEPNLEVNNITETSLLRNQILESQRSLKEKEKELEESKKMIDLEAKMMSTVFHDLGQKKQREGVDQRMASLGHGQSFLARQRQPIGRRVNNAFNSK